MQGSNSKRFLPPTFVIPQTQVATLNATAPLRPQPIFVFQRHTQLHRVLTYLGKCPEQSLGPFS